MQAKIHYMNHSLCDTKDRIRKSNFWESTTKQKYENFHYKTFTYFQFCYQLNNQRALKEAKRNVMKHYPVVGVLERLNQTLYVLEEKLPQYFKGANGLYFNKGSKIQTFSNKMKKSVSWQVRNTIVKRINNEIEFYNFCVKRLQHQYDEILSNQNLNKCIK